MWFQEITLHLGMNQQKHNNYDDKVYVTETTINIT